MSMKNIYRKIAVEYGVSVEEVEREMQNALDYAYQKEDKSEKESALQEGISSKGEVPTPEEFIRGVSRKVRES